MVLQISIFFESFTLSISGYVVIIRNGSRNFTEYLQSNRLQFQKDGLQPNKTYFVTIAARTRIGIGPKLPEIQVQLSELLIIIPVDTQFFPVSI